VDELKERAAEEPSGNMAVSPQRHPEHGQGEPGGLAAQAKERFARVAARSRHDQRAHGDHIHGRRGK
jgi:hypothetical protein